MTDTVEKVGGNRPVRNNRIGLIGSLNQCCALDSCLESILRSRALKIVFQHYRHKADIVRLIVNDRCWGQGGRGSPAHAVSITRGFCG